MEICIDYHLTWEIACYQCWWSPLLAFFFNTTLTPPRQLLIWNTYISAFCSIFTHKCIYYGLNVFQLYRQRIILHVCVYLLSIVLHVPKACSFWVLHGILLCEYTTFYFSFLLLLDVQIVFCLFVCIYTQYYNEHCTCFFINVEKKTSGIYSGRWNG